ncbi:FAD-binding oxidoreductase [Streptomyces acidiscabies]|uniref:FAD-binding oxidoreductase n=1 Tax=Streptomyces acidiscabies TaxID=42234 RepID=UPI00095245BB|nr:FAD-binding oxidoreductase [Streptomyces acidiscabies]
MNATPDFPADFRGALLHPDDDGYDAARAGFNSRTADARPRLIARCRDTADVVTALRHASAHGLPVAVRGGGHGLDAYALPDEAFVIDLSALREISVDPKTRTVRAQAGVLLGELDAAAQVHCLAVPAGTVTSTGVAGLTLGGGIGHLMRSFGATVDNLLGCEVVTVDGRVVRADSETNADLFWGLRGGGGNFGVVTEFTFRAHPVGPEVTSGMILFPGEQAAAVLGELPAFVAAAPRALGVASTLTFAPPLPGLPEELHGEPVLLLLPVHIGDAAEAEELTAKLAALGTPALNTVGRTTWLATNSMLDASAPYGRRAGGRGGYLAELTPEVVDVAIARLDAAPAQPGSVTAVNIWAFGGAFSEDTDEDAMAFSRTGAGWLWETATIWEDREHDADFDTWLDGTATALRPHTLPNAYTNLTQDQGAEWRRGVWGGEAKYRRLRDLKAEWDPRNLLRFNKNIEPAAPSASIRR